MKSLLRWNRAGLKRIRYVGGNAATFLEEMRHAYLDDGALQDWEPFVYRQPEPEGPEPERQGPREVWGDRRDRRLLRELERLSDDMGWELARTFCRAAHVLGEHVDALANEGFLGTASHWDSVRRLVAILDYHPHPPASATTPLVIDAKERGTLNAGFAVESAADGEAGNIVFETLEPIDLDPAFNQLTVVRTEGSTKKFTPAPGAPEDPDINPPFRASRKTPMRSDLPVLIFDVPPPAPQTITPVAARIEREVVEGAERKLVLESSSRDARAGMTVGTTVMQVAPAWQGNPMLHGPGVLRAFYPGDEARSVPRRAHGLAEGDVVAWWDPDIPREEEKDGWVFATVTASDRWGVRFSRDPGADVNFVYRTFEAGELQQAMPGQEEPTELLLPAFKVARMMEGGVIKVLVPGAIGDLLDPVDVSSIDLPLMSFLLAQIYGIPIPLLGLKIPPPWDPALIVTMAKAALGLITDAEAGRGAEAPDPMPTEAEMWLEVEGEYGPSPVGDDPLAAAKALYPAEKPAPNVPAPNTGAVYRLSRDDYDHAKPLYVVPPAQPPIALEDLGGFPFAGDDGSLKVDHWCAAEEPNGDLIALRITHIDRFTDTWTDLAQDEPDGTPTNMLLTLEGRQHTEPLAHLYGALRGEFRPGGFDVQDETVDFSDFVELSDALPAGRRLMLTCCGSSYFATVAEADGKRVRLSPAPPACDCDDMRIHGNVVIAGHGERQPDRFLSGGVGGVPQRYLVLDTKDVSFARDASSGSGVRADIEVWIAERRWRQVDSLSHADPTDSFYTANVLEDGRLRLGFGDGVSGRALPTGTNNVRVRLRVGTGLEGKLAAGKLVKPRHSHPLVREVLQPLETSGGNDKEPLDSVRDNAPASVLTMQRAVSVDDFAHLAAAHSAVWQAAAIYVPTGHQLLDLVEVAVVPAGGGPLFELREELESYLRAHCILGVDVRVSRFRPVPLIIRIELRVDRESYDPNEVKVAVRRQIEQRLSLSQRKLGASLDVSELYNIVEAIPGVENSNCHIEPSEGSPGEFVVVGPTAVAFLESSADLEVEVTL